MATTQTQKKRPPRPTGMARLIPALPVKDVRRAIDFCEKAFGFEKAMAMPAPDGKIVHGEIRYEGEIIAMFGLEGAYGGTCKSPAASKTDCPIMLYVYCDNVDALYAKAKAAGAKVISEPADMFWGDRTVQLADPDGYRWMFATNVADFDASKMPKS
jgi:uncharacterized glyoxalase superfamily protein PhnB